MECWVSFFEIYQGQLYDLLRNRRRVTPCEQKDGQVVILGLEEDRISNVQEALECMQAGLQARITGKTGANAQSSRSHAILSFTLRTPAGGAPLGKISFIDLAGSERGADRAELNNDRRTKLEGSEINKSLLALKECIRAIDQEASHLPFRQSKLTLVLKDSIVGAAVRTAMIATVSPAASSSEHSLNTLRYAERFHEIGTQGQTSKASMPDKENNSLSRNFTDNEPKNIDWAVSPVPFAKHGSTSSSGHPVKLPEATGVTSTRSSTKPSPLCKDTSVRIVTFGTPGIEDRRRRINDLLASMRGGVAACSDPDVLELLHEELANISHAFKSLS